MDGQKVAGALGAMLCALAVVLPIGILIAAVILRAACSFFNKLAGADKSVPEPSFGKAMGIAAATWVVSVIVNILIGLVFGGGAAAAGANANVGGVLAQLVAIPAGFLVMSGMLTAMLPTSFGKSMLITLITYAISLLIVVMVSVVLALVGFGLFAVGQK